MRVGGFSASEECVELDGDNDETGIPGKIDI